jgi:hypothetical protein
MKVIVGMWAKYKNLECKIVDILALGNKATVTLHCWDGPNRYEYVCKNTDLQAVKIGDEWVMANREVA